MRNFVHLNKKLINLFLISFISLLQVQGTAHAMAFNSNAQGESSTVLINNSWGYLENDANTPTQALANANWTTLNLPHTWNATDTIDAEPGYRRSASWYKRNIHLASTDQQHFVLYFEGANYETQVYVNNQLAGEHIGGYVGFEIDITDWVTQGDNNVMVRVSNRYNRNLIPSQKSDFFLYGGITRDVWFKTLPTHYVDKLTIKTPQVSKSSAKTQIEVKLNKTKINPDLSLIAHLISPAGEIIQSKKLNNQALAAAKNQTVNLDFDPLAKPQLWSIDTPNLYKVQVQLLNKDKATHKLTERFGYRWFETIPGKGFLLNGERVLLRGTHRHEESAGVGAALSNEQHRKDMEMIKEMGANFVRLGHYPQDPEIYKAADELGLILWDELPWCRGGKGGAEWEANTERLWVEQINQNINHPSIIFWSLGNEIYWEEDFEGGGADEVIMPYLQHLNQLTKSIDPSRLTSIRKYYPGATTVDTFSPSIWAGWYGGSYSQYEAAVINSTKKYPNFIHMEYGGSSHVGRHTETPISAKGMRGAQASVEEAMNQAVVKSVAKDSDWNENYMVDLFDWHLQVSENLPGLTGTAQWAVKDFGTPLRPENPIPYINQKGLFDRAGNPKDVYYVFKSYWTTEPFCYIESKTWTHRNGPKEGRDVTVYCNTQEAELFLNGQSLGRKTKDVNKVPAGGLVWKTPFNNGENKLTVKGFNSDSQVAEDQLKVTYLVGKHGKQDHFAMNYKKLANGNYLITVEALDKNKNRVLNYSERAYFSNLEGHGQLVENQGTPTGSSIIEIASGVAKIEFIPGNKETTIEFRTQNVKGIYLRLPAK
ncbi:glycoside hydrolase family 2 protein [Catenovulum adriaticum]|uniref:Glycoside hydrolase family 2 protein n=1 Tax=Catenovulum adriaticum TaxID=2984846 RepID=A0ABY7AS09_9ALTE|nr:glycoside hydrolase family 2 TIM barrel-domain containing protein [Catenovulum sp. TS8]WAJ72264.1 glycoside hydrolase family 2 protein [Catenovulum sp. TS8]